jgi:hypothetical protein
MALAFKASNHSHAVGALFKSSHNMDHVDLTGAGNPHDPDICRVLQSHRTCQVRSRVTSEIAAKGKNDRFKIFAHGFPL